MHPRVYLSTIYIDLEGVDLSRDGTLSIVIILIDTGIPTRHACLIDVHTLGAQAFETVGVKNTSLKDVLQDERIVKVFFDVRNDSDALFAHFGVSLKGIEDVQLMESAARKTTASRKYLNGLAKCVATYVLKPSSSGLAVWKLAKDRGERLFQAKHGGSPDVFNQRPIIQAIINYCVGNVQYLSELRKTFWTRKTTEWRQLVSRESTKRVTESQAPEYLPHNPAKAIAPWSAGQNRVMDYWNYVPLRPDFEEFFQQYEDQDLVCDDKDDWMMDMTRSRDIISSWDYDMYYSD
jgi:exonuclease 3'-5' domain-containing protein 1